MFKSIALYKSIKLLNSFKPKYLVPLMGRELSSDDKSADVCISEQLLSNLKRTESQTNENDSQPEPTLSFAKAFKKFEKLSEESKTDKKESNNVMSETFPTLLRYSPFIQMGDPVGKIVVGRVEDVVEDDLYIDFGTKFNAICKRPKANQSDYVRGAKVKIRINDLELSDRFLGSTKDMTLLEADATLMGIIWSPARTTERTESETV